MTGEPAGRQSSLRTWYVFGAAFVVYLVSTHFANTVYDNHVLLADAFLHGRPWIPQPAPAIDALSYEGHWYIIEGPLPAVILLPLVAIFGLQTNQVPVAAACAAIAVASADLLFARMGIRDPLRSWLTAFLGFGTVLFWATAFPAVWMFAHVIAVMFALLAILECYGRGRPWLVGLLVACAALTRFPMILAAIPMSYLLYARYGNARLRAVFGFLCGFVPLLVLYGFYNEARFGTPSDIGYTVWYHQDQVGQPTGLPFQLQYLPFNLYSFFFLPPNFQAGFPWLVPTSAGVALTFTSPALALAFLVNAKARESIVWWVATVLTALPSLLYYVNGFEQFGMRHSLDFTPFALPLVARGLQRYPAILPFALIAFSIAANAYGVWYSWAFHAFTVVPR